MKNTCLSYIVFQVLKVPLKVPFLKVLTKIPDFGVWTDKRQQTYKEEIFMLILKNYFVS